MARFIAEYQLSAAGGKITLPTCSRFLGVKKVGSGFVLITEVWGDPEKLFEVDINVFHKNEYMRKESVYIGCCATANTIFHFSYTPVDVIDIGGDGGIAPGVKATSVKPAGGMEVC